MKVKNACLGFQILRAPPSWIIVSCRDCAIVSKQKLFVWEQQGQREHVTIIQDGGAREIWKWK